MSKITESKRVKNFRLSLARLIPKFPNNKHSLQALEPKSLGDLLIDHANWAIRYVALRPRFVEIHPTATQDRRWKILNSEINQFLSKVRNGEDLTPHLSLQPHTQGYTPAAALCGVDSNRWADKDFLLNVWVTMGRNLNVVMPDISNLYLDRSPLISRFFSIIFEIMKRA